MPAIATVAVGIALERQFDYQLPPDARERVAVGMRVLVPLGHSVTTGYVTAVGDHSSYSGKLREVREVLDERPTFTLELLQFLRWSADYYHSPLGELLRKALPPSLHSRERVRLVLTPAGEARRETEAELAAIPERGVALGRARAEFGRERVARWEAEGLVGQVREVAAGGAQGREVQVVTLVRFDLSEVTGPVQREMLSFLHEKQRVTRAELRSRFKSADGALRGLCRRGLVALSGERQYRSVAAVMAPPAIPAALTPEQADAVARIGAAVGEGGYRAFLLHGVTGSGKTEVYHHAIGCALAAGRSALVLVPEIALTPQLMAAFEGRFPGRVAVLHSALSPGERYDQWCRAATGDAPIVVGARSALFAPLERLGLIVVDEEHEPSYKQDERPYYNARDLALVRGRLVGATVVLGSATPSLESVQNVVAGKLMRLSLTRRATPRPLPDIALLDLRQVGFADGDRIISRPLDGAIRETLQERSQVILFLNRKGFAAFLLCESCGLVPRCPHCDISLTYYKKSDELRCHYCRYGLRRMQQCPACNGQGLREVGFGTERVMESLAQLYPEARAARLEAGSGTALGATLGAFRRGEIDILVGTQIIAKGHDFPGVTLVGVLSADLSLAFPDFRAAERTFQLLTQVAGRAGRGERPGRVFIQSYMPNHYALGHALRHDFEGFVRAELEQRRLRGFPPFAFLALMRLSATRLEACREAAEKAVAVLVRSQGGDLVVLGPTMAPLAFVRDRYRMQILLRSSSRSRLAATVSQALPVLAATLGGAAALRWDLDIDPVNLM